MTTKDHSSCAIWPEFPAKEMHDSNSFVKRSTYYDSPRAGGKYEITEAAADRLRYLDNAYETLRIKARLTTWLVEMRRKGEEWPIAETDVVEQSVTSAPFDVDERAMRLLQHLASIQPSLGGTWQMSGDDIAMALAISESINSQELDFLFGSLTDRGYVETQISADLTLFGFGVTMDGFEKANEANRIFDSARAFVAMWFDPSVGRLYDDGIEPAIEQAGYSAYVVNRDPSVNKIDDAIIAAIRDSRFMVADFTHGGDGVRGSVYFEAGFAYGIEIPVIHTCRADQIEGLHFDTRQYNHIDWAEPKDVVERLRDAIVARVGPGPTFAGR